MTGKHTAGMPAGVRRALVWAAITLAVVAAAGNFGHVFDFADLAQGPRQSVVVALLPDVALILCVVKLRYQRRSVPAWLGLVTSILFVGVAVWHQADDWVGRLTGLWPLWVACLAAMMIELEKPAREAAGAPAVEGAADPVAQVVPEAVAQVAAQPVPEPAVEGSREVAPKPARKPAGETRAAIARILADGPRTVADLQEQGIDISAQSIREHLGRLGAKRLADGTYRLPIRKAS